MDIKSSTSGDKQASDGVPKQNKHCSTCKLISVSCLLSIGGYLFYQGRNQTSYSKIVLFSLAAASTGLGIGEIFNKSPFRNY